MDEHRINGIAHVMINLHQWDSLFVDGWVGGGPHLGLIVLGPGGVVWYVDRDRVLAYRIIKLLPGEGFVELLFDRGAPLDFEDSLGKDHALALLFGEYRGLSPSEFPIAVDDRWDQSSFHSEASDSPEPPTGPAKRLLP